MTGYIMYVSVWGMRVGKDSLLSSISADSTDLKGIQTRHNLFTDFGADKTFITSLSGDRVQVWVQLEHRALAGCLAITPECCPEDNRRF